MPPAVPPARSSGPEPPRTRPSRYGSPAAQRERFRRAVALLVMTLLLPGSAQLVAGNRDVGRLALRVWLGLLATAAVVLAVGYLWHGLVFFLAGSAVALGLLRLVLTAAAVGWALLFIDAWRIGRPLELMQRQRLAVVGINGVLCFSVAGALLFASHVVTVQRDLVTAMFGDGAADEATDGRYNVLLLGGDSGEGRWGLRPDSISVASVDAETGRAVLFGLPRNLTNFSFAEGTELARYFPDGYDCAGCELNGLATWAADHPRAFRGEADKGVAATTEAVESVTGLDIHYHAMVNMQGFRSMVQAVGGLELNVRDRIPIGGVGGPVTGWIEPGVQRLDGFETLWFARSREAADDYSRMARQKCVMNAMLQQLSPSTVIAKFGDIAEASTDLVSTDLPASELGTMAELALRTRSKPVASVSFVPPSINTADPDLARIHRMVERAVERSEARDEQDQEEVAAADAAGGPAGRAGRDGAERPRTGFDTRVEDTTVGGSLGTYSEGYAANEAADLSSAC